MMLRAALAACLLAAIGPAVAALQPCRVAGIRNEVQCGVIARALDPARPGGVTIDVHYVVVPALARRKLLDPVFLLAGGPGQSAIALAPTVLPLFARLNNRRDIVFVDQRGTGRSAPLACADTRQLPLAEQLDPERQVEQLARCRAELQQLPYGDLRFFTTTIAMQDLDAVRAQLGAERINVVGASYGTRAALELLRQFPGRVRRSLLDGVAPPDMALPASSGVDGQAAFDAMLAACEHEAACAQRHPTLRADWASLASSPPRRVTVMHPLTGQSESLTLTRAMLLTALRGPLYVPSLAAALPQAIADAAQGRFEPLLGLNSVLATRREMAPAMGMHFSVVCAEDLPRLAAADFRDDIAALYQRVCAGWPRGEVPAAFYAIPTSGSPVLLLSGGLDPATPPRHAERVARALGRNALQVVAPNAGHGVMNLPCMRDVLFRFIDAADDAQALAADASCVKSIPRPPAFEPLQVAR
ncbi:MAG TPA: alpha/beta hydrolase [Albitalea sp.]|nr:alpha/beta hydrolase [Albitalea sp.]HJW10585.1 alpha/beta hydrolase [Albitalea sp.]